MECLENRCLVLKRTGMLGILMKKGDAPTDAVDDQGEGRYWIEAQDPVGDSESLQPLILGRLVVW